MASSETPSPVTEAGWSSPGLTASHDFTSGLTATRHNLPPSGDGKRDVTWDSARARSAEVNSFPAFNPKGQGFLRRISRKVSKVFPRLDDSNNRHLAEKEKPSLSRLMSQNLLVQSWRYVWKMRLRFMTAFILYYFISMIYTSWLQDWYVRSPYGGGGNKFVIILAANVGGGVMEWKTPKQWASERDSVRNKKKYAKRWGYNLEILDLTAQRKYAHEWREGWEKADVIQRCMSDYPQAEWFWWLDLNTLIMEPGYSLQKHLFNDLNANTYRDINLYNPLNMIHPFNDTYLDSHSKSPIGDGRPDSINLILSQDCGGFNLGSFFIRRSAWTDQYLDMWWDPVAYDQRHMTWAHKEQDALQHMYRFHPWVRSHVAFTPQRMINSFPPGACGRDDPTIHYRDVDRDFVVNMAGCEFGRDCWGEMYYYRELSEQLNLSMLARVRQWIRRLLGHLFIWNRSLSNTDAPQQN